MRVKMHAHALAVVFAFLVSPSITTIVSFLCRAAVLGGQGLDACCSPLSYGLVHRSAASPHTAHRHSAEPAAIERDKPALASISPISPLWQMKLRADSWLLLVKQHPWVPPRRSAAAPAPHLDLNPLP